LTRLTQPLVRDHGALNGRGVLRPASWDEALDCAAAGFRKALDEGAQTGLFSCSKTTNELNYATQKFSRVALHSNNVDSCNRT
jgi:formate dehydrogenase major subunit